MTALPPLPSGFDVQAEFPIVAHWDFFNHAGVAPISNRAFLALEKYNREARDDSYLTGRWYEQAEQTRIFAAKLINAQPEEIAFVKNTSEGLAFVANGLDWRTGDEVVSTAVEYPANYYPWVDLERRLGVKHVKVAERNGRIELSEVLSALTSKTRLVALSHVEYASGFRHDLAAIGEACRKRRILFCVDAIQSLGALPLDVRAMNIDYLAADGHKWMLGPEGCGFFFCRRALLTSLRPEIGWFNVVNALDFGNYDFTLRPDARRFECGSYNIPGVLALGASLKLLNELDIQLISQRIFALTDHLCEGLQRKGYRVFSSRAASERSGIVCFTSDKHNHEAIVRELKQQKIILITREGRLRASPHFYNSLEQIERLLSALPK